jgi:hypothetical protein
MLKADILMPSQIIDIISTLAFMCAIRLCTLINGDVSQLPVGQISSNYAHLNRHPTFYKGRVDPKVVYILYKLFIVQRPQKWPRPKYVLCNNIFES